jgi:predicted transcriptional regulator
MSSIRYDPRTDDEYMQFLNSVRSYAIKAMEYKGFTYSDIAEKTYRSHKTIKRFIEGDTFAPQLPTVFGILKAVDVSLKINSSYRQVRRKEKTKNVSWWSAQYEKRKKVA